MVKKLTFLLKHKIASRLAFKTAVGTLALFLAFWTDFSFWPFVLMIGVALWLYFSLLSERKSIRMSFWLTWLLAFLALKFVALVFFPWLIFPIFAAMLFIILGLGRLFFTDSFLTFGIFNTIFFLFFWLVAFYFSGHESFFWLGPIFFFLTFVVLAEYFKFFGLVGRRRLVFAAVLAFLAVGFLFILMFLPLGFINAAAFLTLFLIVARDISIFHFRGVLDVPFVFRELTVFFFVAIVILAASQWAI